MDDRPARDVVVIGSGHNALVAACYLARDGLDVEVIERDTVLGGAVSTVQRFPGYRVDRGSSAHIMIRRTGIIEELDLSSVGLTYRDLDPWGFAPFRAADGSQQALTFWVDVDHTCASIAAMCGERDAAAYRSFVADWTARNERIFAAFDDLPTPARLGRSLWGLGRVTGLGGARLAHDFLRSADDLLDATFNDERLKTALAWLGAQSGPPTHEPATADLVGWLATLHTTPPGHPVGGSGALTQALARRLGSYGGSIRAGHAVTKIVVKDGTVCGVCTSGGQVVSARRVVAGCHVGTTLALLGDALPAGLAERGRRIPVGNGIGMAVRLGTTAPPRYPADADAVGIRGLQLLAQSRLELRAAYGDYLAGRPPRAPVALVMSPSVLDDTIAPAGRHNVSIWGQWHPYRLAGGESWSDIGRREADKLIERVEAAAPGFADSIEHIHVQTPADLERELALPAGNVMHVPMGLGSMFAFRPLPELAGHTVPGVAGLYLTGASTHPGGGVFGVSGRTVARLVSGTRRGARSSFGGDVGREVRRQLGRLAGRGSLPKSVAGADRTAGTRRGHAPGAGRGGAAR